MRCGLVNVGMANKMKSFWMQLVQNQPDRNCMILDS